MRYDWFHNGLILDIGLVVLALVLFRYARILGGLLRLINRPPVEIWLYVAGWLLILGFAVPHYLALATLYPNLSNPDLLYYLWVTRTLTFVATAGAAVLALIPSLLYYRWTNQ